MKENNTSVLKYQKSGPQLSNETIAATALDSHQPSTVNKPFIFNKRCITVYGVKQVAAKPLRETWKKHSSNKQTSYLTQTNYSMVCPSFSCGAPVRSLQLYDFVLVCSRAITFELLASINPM
jgi:hypothetical protein